MYDYLGYVSAGLVLLVGLIALIFPKQATKEELRDDETAIKKARKYGMLMTIVGFLVLIMLILVG